MTSSHPRDNAVMQENNETGIIPGAIPFAKNPQGRLIPPDQVPPGLPCGCHCPACGEETIPQQQDGARPSHFIHRYAYPDETLDCIDTTVHQSACEYLRTAASKWLKLPKSKPDTIGAIKIAYAHRDAPIPGTGWCTDVLITSRAVKNLSDPGDGHPYNIKIAVEISVNEQTTEEFAYDVTKAEHHCIEISMPPEELWRRASEGMKWTTAMRGMLLLPSSDRTRWIYPPLPTCRYCGTDVYKGQEHCWECNPAYNHCPNCGTRKKIQFNLCYNCYNDGFY